MGSFNRMREQLKHTGLYTLNGKSLVEAEMNAYAKAIDSLLTRAEAMARDCFLDEIESTKGWQFEDLFGLPSTQFPLNDARRAERAKKVQMMKDRLNVKHEDSSGAAIAKLIATRGVTVTFAENFSTNTITVTEQENLGYCETSKEKTEFITSCLPCHAKVVFKT